jgi:hypothetical protein
MLDSALLERPNGRFQIVKDTIQRLPAEAKVLDLQRRWPAFPQLGRHRLGRLAGGRNGLEILAYRSVAMASPALDSAATQIRPFASQVRLRAFERFIGDRASDVRVEKGALIDVTGTP